MSFGQRRGSSSDDVPPPRTRPGSLSSRASGVPSVIGTSKRVGVVGNNAQQNTTAAGAAKENVKRAAFGSSVTTAAGGPNSGKENVARNGATRPSSARSATRVSVERAPLQVCQRPDVHFFFIPPHHTIL